MGHYYFDSEEYWENCPPELENFRSHNDGIRNAYFVMGKKEDDAPTVMIMDLPPGAVIRHHFHDCERVEVVIRGEIRVGDKIFRPGDVMTASLREAYGPNVAGPNGATTAEIFSNYHSATETNYPELGEGGAALTVDLTDPDFRAKLPPKPAIS